MELDAIAAVLRSGERRCSGGSLLTGNFGGALIIQLIRYTLLANGVPDAAAQVVKQPSLSVRFFSSADEVPMRPRSQRDASAMVKLVSQNSVIPRPDGSDHFWIASLRPFPGTL